MEKFAAIKTGGKQYLVKAGDEIKVEKLSADENGDFVFDQVLLVATPDGKEVKVGTPALKVKVEAKVMVQGKYQKIRVVKYKNKTRYHKVYGHKQPYTKVKIEKIS